MLANFTEDRKGILGSIKHFNIFTRLSADFKQKEYAKKNTHFVVQYWQLLWSVSREMEVFLLPRGWIDKETVKRS